MWEMRERRERCGAFRGCLCCSCICFVSGFLCDWRFVYTKTDGFPTRLPEISGRSDFESRQTQRALCFIYCKRYCLVAGVRSCLLRSAAEFLPRPPPRAFIRENKQRAEGKGREGRSGQPGAPPCATQPPREALGARGDAAVGCVRCGVPPRGWPQGRGRSWLRARGCRHRHPRPRCAVCPGGCWGGGGGVRGVPGTPLCHVGGETPLAAREPWGLA